MSEVRKINVNLAQVSGSHTNFPMLFSGTYSYLKTVANGGSVQNSNGYDIEFVDEYGLRLNWELLKYVATTGEIIAFVKIPSLTSTSQTQFYLKYGTPGITTNVGNPTGVWDTNYLSVYHLGDGTTLSLSDSTSNANTLTNNNSVTATTGKIYGGAALSAASSQSLGGSVIVSNDLNVTVSAWIKVASFPATNFNVNIAGMINGVDSGYLDKIIKIYTSSDYAAMYVYNPSAGGAIYAYDTTSLTTNTWIYIAGTTDNVNNVSKAFKNGVVGDVTTAKSTTTGYTNPNLYIGARGANPYVTNGGDFYTGDISEVRFSKTVRSPEWILTEYNNQNSPSTFYSVSTFVTGGYVTGISTINNTSNIIF